MNINKLIDEFNKDRKAYQYSSNKDTLIELNLIANEILEYNNIRYNEIANDYIKLKKLILNDDDRFLWNKLLEIFQTISKDKPSILDIGSGSGRDLVYATNLGLDIVGIDNNSIFIRYLNSLVTDGLLKSDSVFYCDMLKLIFKDRSFNILRYNASLLHIPVTDKGYMCDKVLQEAYRVLSSNGLLFITVKYGFDLLELINENDGMGYRIYQLYNEKSLNNICSRNLFEIIYEYIYSLNSRKMLAIIAKKVDNV